MTGSSFSTRPQNIHHPPSARIPKAGPEVYHLTLIYPRILLSHYISRKLIGILYSKLAHKSNNIVHIWGKFLLIVVHHLPSSYYSFYSHRSADYISARLEKGRATRFFHHKHFAFEAALFQATLIVALSLRYSSADQPFNNHCSSSLDSLIRYRLRESRQHSRFKKSTHFRGSIVRDRGLVCIILATALYSSPHDNGI